MEGTTGSDRGRSTGRRRTLSIAALALLLAATVLAACASSPDEGATPGYDDSPTTLDTTPFQMAESSRHGSTTLPPGFFEVPTDDGPTTTEPNTTTTAAGQLVLPDTSKIDSLCGFERTVAPYQDILSLAPAQVQQFMVALGPIIDRYAEVAPAQLRPDLHQLSSSVGQLRDLLAANRWDTTSGAFDSWLVQVHEDAANEVPGSFPVLLAAAVTAEHSLCG